MKKIIGIDDAGKGPVIGPMVLAGVIIDENQQDTIKDTGAKDSKLLAPKKRKEIFEKIKKEFEYHVEITSAQEIDECDNLNNLEATKTAMIINKLSQGIKEEIVAIIDCPSVNISAWSEFVRKLVINKNIKIQAEHKADFNHPIVSAASIVAKENREEQIEKIKKELGIDFGSGYPGDPKTVEFIEKNYNNKVYTKIIRHSWATVKNLVIKNKQKKLF